MKNGIAYDLASLPKVPYKQGKMITPGEILEIMNERGILFYDSREGQPPMILDQNCEVKFIDTKDMTNIDPNEI